MLTSAQKSDNEIYVYIDVPITFQLSSIFTEARFRKVLHSPHKTNSPLICSTKLCTCDCRLAINVIWLSQTLCNVCEAKSIDFYNEKKKPTNRKISPNEMNSSVKTDSKNDVNRFA